MNDLTRFQDALLYAAQRHASQTMKGGETPYVAHVLGVASITFMYGGTEDEAIAALLHDTIEDAATTPELLEQIRGEIRERFGENVLQIVEECTDAFEHPKPEWWGRKQKHVASLREASHSARLVYAADKLQNARAILQDRRVQGDALWTRFKGGKAGSLWYFHALIDVFRETQTCPALVDEVVRAVNAIESLAYTAPEHSVR